MRSLFGSKRSLTRVLLVLSLVLISAAQIAVAQFPTKPVTAIIPFSPGGGNDILIRLVAKYVEPYLGKALVAENRAGAGGQIGWTAAARSRADGYTLVATSLPSMNLLTSLRSDATFKMDEFVYICNFQSDPIVWVVNKDGNLKTAKDVVAYAKANPKKLNVAGDGPQSNVQLQHLVASDILGINTNFVSYSGSAPALTALLGKQVELAASTLSAALSHIEGGRLVPIMVFADKPLPGLKGVPTPQEAFGTKVPSVGSALRGIAAPKNTPAAVIAKLESAFAQAVKDPEFVKQAAAVGITIEFLGSAEFTKVVNEYTTQVEAYKHVFNQ